MNKFSLAPLAAILLATAALPALAAQPAGADAGSGNSKQGQRTERFLKQFDADASGSVTLAELQAYRGEMFASVDADNSGSLSEEEFGMIQQMRDAKRAEMKAGKPATSATKQAGRGPTLAKLDADKNGTISLVEFNARTPKMFNRLDRNHDGVINGDDLAKNRASAN